MTKFVIRTMTTTDWRPGQHITPYHLYLRPAHERTSAYWVSYGKRAEFDSIEEAEAEIEAWLRNDKTGTRRPDIVPVNDRDVPTYWDARKTGHRVVGTELVIPKN